MNGIPKTDEEFRLWMVDKVGEIHTATAGLSGKIDVSNANHSALQYRMDNVEKAAKSAKNWENAKLLIVLGLQGLSRIFHG